MVFDNNETHLASPIYPAYLVADQLELFEYNANTGNKKIIAALLSKISLKVLFHIQFILSE